ncbi:thiamine-phosphate kinase [soil metagenome]
MSGGTVRDLGEFGLIERLREVLPDAVRVSPDLIAGIGDDTAVWRPSPGEDLLITTDAMIEGIHFELSWTDWYSLGWKSLAVNISDIASMGGAPKVAVITLGLQGDLPVSGLLDCYRGIGDIASAYGVVVAGGDIVSSPAGMMLSVTVFGETIARRYLARSGAQAGDVIAVSGSLGAAAAGLRLLLLTESDTRRDATTAPRLVGALHRPVPRVALGQKLLALGATAAMDLSDGLLGDLPKILQASGVAAEIWERDIPIAAAVHALFPDEWLELGLRGGEDYELLFTAPPAALNAITGAAVGLGQTVTAIGSTLERREDEPALVMMSTGGERVPIAAGAFDHFG